VREALRRSEQAVVTFPWSNLPNDSDVGYAAVESSHSQVGIRYLNPVSYRKHSLASNPGTYRRLADEFRNCHIAVQPPINDAIDRGSGPPASPRRIVEIEQGRRGIQYGPQRRDMAMGCRDDNIGNESLTNLGKPSPGYREMSQGDTGISDRYPSQRLRQDPQMKLGMLHAEVIQAALKIAVTPLSWGGHCKYRMPASSQAVEKKERDPLGAEDSA
jgi:hypothetical protein